uniref:Uncharacterized protein n=1 Tax=Salmo trutta TaxID=8032 RepID=A0A674A5E0_SALTR
MVLYFIHLLWCHFIVSLHVQHFALHSALKRRRMGCFKISNCRRIMKDGSGVINLAAIGDSDGFLSQLKPVPSENVPLNAEILLSFNMVACLTVRYLLFRKNLHNIHMQIWVENPYACPNTCALGDVGPGTIVLSLNAITYFILGSSTLHPFRTGSGVQIAPEESVWCMLGYMFTKRRRNRGAEDTSPY